MPSHKAPNPSITTWLTLLGTILAALPFAFFNFAKNYYHHAQAGKWPWTRTALISAGRYLGGAIPLSLARQIQPTTGAKLRRIAKREGLDLVSRAVKVPGWTDVELHEFAVPQATGGDEKRRTVLIYWYGGGFNEPIADFGHVNILSTACRRAKIGRVVMVETTCAPEAKYPSPLAQSVAAVNAVLSRDAPDGQKVRPENVVLAGDSAGGNVVLSLLAHAIRPHPDIIPINIKNGETFRGAASVSPWVTFDSTASSYVDEPGWDMIQHRILSSYTTNYAPKREVWAEPVLEGGNFWAKAPVQNIFLSLGEWELFRDDCLTMGMLLQDGLGKDRVRVVEGKAEIHCHFLMANIEGKSYGTRKALEEWIEGLHRGN